MTVKASSARDPITTYPLQFVSLPKARVWGGRRLQAHYDKPVLADDTPCGESWELVDLPDDQSVVQNGPLAQATLGELVRHHRDWLMGSAELLDGRFPLLLKLIDAQKTLSVQVHPDAAVAAALGGRPKTEAWVVLHADPHSVLYLGLKRGVTRKQLAEACKGPSLEHLVHRVPVTAGDVVFIPAGTVHAIGGGLVLAEMQQASDTTYRLHDWGRVGLDGKPRTLHLDEALQAIHYDQLEDPPPWQPHRGPGRVVAGPDFVIELQAVQPQKPVSYEMDVPLVVLCLGNTLRVKTGERSDDSATAVLQPGQCALVPAAAGRCVVECGADVAAQAHITWPRSRAGR
jgi:mannose-6-phosphate isomerase